MRGRAGAGARAGTVAVLGRARRAIRCPGGRTRSGNTTWPGGSGSGCWCTLPGPTRRETSGLPAQQSDDDARLQQAHRDHIFRSGEHYKEFASPTDLVREVFYDLGLNPESVKVNNLPFKTLGSLFKGREDFLRQIRDVLGRVDHRGHQRVAAITASASAATVHGLGGIGKTRAAIEYAHRHADDFTALLFVRADSAAGLQQNLAALCGPLVLDLPEKEARETEVQVAAVLRWLQQHPGWFLIFDNVDSEAAAQAVEKLLSQLSTAGQVLVTSRLSGWSGAVESLALDVLAEADAAAFLLERTEERRRKAARRSRARHGGWRWSSGSWLWRWNRPGPTS